MDNDSSSPAEPDNLLEQLESTSTSAKRDAIDRVIREKIREPRVIEALKRLATLDPNDAVRDAAQSALGALESTPPPPTTAWLTPARRDFIIGFVGWYVVNGLLLWAVITAVNVSLPGQQLMSLLILLGNILVLFILAFKRPRVAFGVLSAYAVIFLLVLLLATLLAVLCGIVLLSSSL